jgi:hypothetical protein
MYIYIYTHTKCYTNSKMLHEFHFVHVLPLLHASNNLTCDGINDIKRNNKLYSYAN